MAKKRGPDTFISRLFTRHAGLRRVEGRRAREMARVMKDVKRQALSLVDRNMTTFHEAGEYIDSAAAVSRANQTVAGIDALMAQRSDWATSEVLSMRKEAWTQGVADIEFAAGRLPGDVQASMQASFGQAFPEAAFSAVEHPVLGVAPDAMFNGVRAGTTQNMRDVLVNAVISGESVQETGRRLSDAMDLSVAAGERIARTNVNAMYNEAQRSVYDANADIIAGYAWEATLDDRTSQVCFMLHGQFWPTGSKTPGPPAHWNCRSILVPVFKDPSVQELLDDTPRRAKQYTKTGKARPILVKGSTTPEQWARRQPSDVSLGITGSKLKNSLFRRKLIGFDDLVDPSLRVRTDQEIIKRAAALHPGNKALQKQARAMGIKTIPSPASVRKADAALAKKQPWRPPEPPPGAPGAPPTAPPPTVPPAPPTPTAPPTEPAPTPMVPEVPEAPQPKPFSIEDLSPREQKALDGWLMDYEEINDQLRATRGDPGDWLDNVAALEDAIRNSPNLDKGEVLWRGLEFADASDIPQGLRAGNSIVDYGFTSVSRSRKVAEDFTLARGGMGERYLMRITLETEMKAAPVPSDLQELLIHRSAEFKKFTYEIKSIGQPTAEGYRLVEVGLSRG